MVCLSTTKFKSTKISTTCMYIILWQYRRTIPPNINLPILRLRPNKFNDCHVLAIWYYTGCLNNSVYNVVYVPHVGVNIKVHINFLFILNGNA